MVTDYIVGPPLSEPLIGQVVDSRRQQGAIYRLDTEAHGCPGVFGRRGRGGRPVLRQQLIDLGQDDLQVNRPQAVRPAAQLRRHVAAGRAQHGALPADRGVFKARDPAQDAVDGALHPVHQ